MIQRPPQPRTIVYADPDSERSVIACMIVAPQCIGEVESYLGADDFADPANGKLFRFIVNANAAGKPVGDQKWMLSQIKTLDLGTDSVSYATRLFKDMPSSHAHVVYFAENVLNKAMLRQQDELRTRFSMALDKADADPHAVRMLLESGLAGMIPSRSSEACHISEVMREVIERQEEERKSGKAIGIQFGVPSIDRTLGVIRNGELVIVAARPGCGKTSLAMQAAVSNAEDGKKVVVVSLEMSKEEIALGHLCQRAALDSSVMRSGLTDEGDIDSLRQAAAADAELPIWLVSPSQATFQKIAAEARYAKLTTGLSLLVIDYLQLVVADKADRNKSRYEIVTETSRDMKRLARELDCPVIVLAQLNREAAEGPPQASHLRDSGAIEADADVILLIDIPEKRGVSPDPALRTEPGAIPATVSIPKYRHGATGAIDVWFYGEARMFADRVSKSFNADLDTYNRR